MKSKLLSLYSDVSVVVFVLSFVSLITLVLVATFGYLDEQSRVVVEVQSTYVVDTKSDKLRQGGFNLGETIEKDSFNAYYLKGKRIEEGIFSGFNLDEVVELPISKEVYDNIKSLGVTEVIYDNSSNVEVYNEYYVNRKYKFVSDYAIPMLIVFLLSLANLYFVPDLDKNHIIRLKG